jgi:DSF synthase
MRAQVTYLDNLNFPYHQMRTRYESECGIMWYHMAAKPRPCFNLPILKELKKFVDSLPDIHKQAPGKEENGALRYTVFASMHPGVFSLGGDLEILSRLSKAKDIDGLRAYSRACIDVVYSGMVNHHLPITTISLVQGDAMGGGFEAALCNNVVIAEKSAKFGFPEVLFNLFPGMGAHKLLSRRVDPGRVQKMISSGNMYGAEELHDMGLVDVVADDGDGENAVYRFIRTHSRRISAFRSLLRVRDRLYPVFYEELIEIADIWVDAAMELGERDLRLIERLLNAQDRMVGQPVAKDEVEQAES